MMNRIQIETAKAEAQRFIEAADAALDRLDEELGFRSFPEQTRKPSPADYSYGSKATGTLRRRSMDLTRTLADLRRPQIWT